MKAHRFAALLIAAVAAMAATFVGAGCERTSPALIPEREPAASARACPPSVFCGWVFTSVSFATCETCQFVES